MSKTIESVSSNWCVERGCRPATSFRRLRCLLDTLVASGLCSYCVQSSLCASLGDKDSFETGSASVWQSFCRPPRRHPLNCATKYFPCSSDSDHALGNCPNYERKLGRREPPAPRAGTRRDSKSQACSRVLSLSASETPKNFKYEATDLSLPN